MNPIVVKTMNALTENGFNTEFFQDKTILKKYLLGLIEPNKSVGVGGSKTIQDIGIIDDLKIRGNKVYWHWLADDFSRNQVLFNASNSDIYFSSSNGITQDGKIVNIDGLGNRISSLCYGHKKVYIIVGINKISEDVNSSINRIKTEACPKNAERLNLQTPCRYTHKCTDCKSKDRMCNITCIIEKQPMKGNITICIVNEVLGF